MITRVHGAIGEDVLEGKLGMIVRNTHQLYHVRKEALPDIEIVQMAALF